MQINKGYPTDWLYQLKQKSDIVSVVSRYVHLEKKGSKYWGCCPFHNEKTPSFSVSQEEGLFHCFGCKEGGDVISFVEKIESCDFNDAVKLLAEQAHMEVPNFTGDKDVFAKKQAKERILKLLDATWKHYQQNLYLPEAKKAQEYIKLRGFTRRELEDFKLGYSLNWTELLEYLKKLGFTYKEMVDAGVAQEKNNRYYDVMAERLIFPIFNSFNECIGFSARVLEKTDFAKYKNTAETLVFQKGKVVFGINLLKSLKQSGGLQSIIIVEGQIDVIAMHRAGFKSTVACMGTALTVENARELKKICDKIILCFDGDSAGEKATKRSLDILKQENFFVKVVTLPKNADPDEILKQKGKDYLQELIDGALPVMDYLINTEKDKFDLGQADQKGQFAKAVLEHLRKMGSPTEEEPYLEKLRDLTAIPIDVLRRDLMKQPTNEKQTISEKKDTETVLTARENGNIRAIKFVLASLIHHKEYVDKNVNYLKLMPSYETLIRAAEEDTKVSSYFDMFDVENMPILKECLFFSFESYADTAARYFQECLWQLADGELKLRQQALTEKFKKCEDNTQRLTIMKEINEVTKQLREKSLEDFYVR